jgi:hypothetical protein
MTNIELVCAILALSTGGLLMLLLAVSFAYFEVRDGERFWRESYHQLQLREKKASIARLLNPKLTDMVELADNVVEFRLGDGAERPLARWEFGAASPKEAPNGRQ